MMDRLVVKFEISIFDIFTKRKDNCRSGYCKQLLVDNEFKPDYVEIYYVLKNGILKPLDYFECIFLVACVFFLLHVVTDNAVLLFIE